MAFDEYYLFGAGDYGRRALSILGKDRVIAFLDNDPKKSNTVIDEIPVLLFSDIKEKIAGSQILISVSPEKYESIANSLRSAGLSNFEYFEDVFHKLILEASTKSADNIDRYHKAIQWIYSNTEETKGIRVVAAKETLYPEVTGYFIPTLLQWGYKELAVQYAHWLCSIQKKDGSWFGSDGQKSYLFDSAQVLKGLLAIRDLLPAVDKSIIAGCDYILSCQNEEGRLVAPAEDAFRDPKTCNELIHLYCISPLIEAGKAFNRNDYIVKAQMAKTYYLDNYRDRITHFHLLSHFYAYVLEGLLDLGEEDLCREAVENLLNYQKEDGSIPAYCDVNWVCSTGLFQIALVLFRLGDVQHGKLAFDYMLKYQNPSGGWYGSYFHPDFQDEVNTYFRTDEISWVCKYFLDALFWLNKATFNEYAGIFKETYSTDDGRYKVIENLISDEIGVSGKRIADVGCGKGGI